MAKPSTQIDKPESILLRSLDKFQQMCPKGKFTMNESDGGTTLKMTRAPAQPAGDRSPHCFLKF